MIFVARKAEERKRWQNEWQDDENEEAVDKDQGEQEQQVNHYKENMKNTIMGEHWKKNMI